MVHFKYLVPNFEILFLLRGPREAGVQDVFDLLTSSSIDTPTPKQKKLFFPWLKGFYRFQNLTRLLKRTLTVIAVAHPVTQDFLIQQPSLVDKNDKKNSYPKTYFFS